MTATPPGDRPPITFNPDLWADATFGAGRPTAPTTTPEPSTGEPTRDWYVMHDHGRPGGDHMHHVSYTHPGDPLVATLADHTGVELVTEAEAFPGRAATEVESLRALVDRIYHLHTDSIAGPCPSCGRIGDISDTDDGLVDHPCPTVQMIEQIRGPHVACPPGASWVEAKLQALAADADRVASPNAVQRFRARVTAQLGLLDQAAVVAEVVTASGRVLSDADIQALADEAEAGYDVDQMIASGRWVIDHAKVPDLATLANEVELEAATDGARFRARPATVAAIQWRGTNWPRVRAFLIEHLGEGCDPGNTWEQDEAAGQPAAGDNLVLFEAWCDDHEVDVFYWIVLYLYPPGHGGPSGEVMAPDVFAARFELESIPPEVQRDGDYQG